MVNNTSIAIVQKRLEPADSLDYFPTPHWATRALCEYIIEPSGTVLEPACGEGDMAKPLTEYFDTVKASDIFDYGYGEVNNYLSTPASADWIITNPPFNLALEFITKANKEAKVGVAMILRSAFVESIGRYNNLFSVNPPTIVAPFAERVAMFKGKLDRKGGSAMSYSWFVWSKDNDEQTKMQWIPPSRKLLEQDKDWK